MYVCNVSDETHEEILSDLMKHVIVLVYHHLKRVISRSYSSV